MSDLYFYDDARARGFEPLALMRPAAELRSGALLIRERWEMALGGRGAGLVVAAHLRDFAEAGAPLVITGAIRAGSVLINARCAVALHTAPTADVWRCDGRVAAVRLRQPVSAEQLADGTLTLESLAAANAPHVDVQGHWMDEVWHFIRDLTVQLNEDIPVLGRAATQLPANHGARTGAHPVFVESNVVVEPMVFFDVSAGPVLIREGATVQAFTRLVGPCVVGRESVVSTDRVANSSIGDACRVHGELSTSILIGHSNKGHTGFVGHSYLGRWVNLGAGTVTSNLKNTYGSVSLWTPAGVRDTEMQFLGTLLGDHAKTGIGVRLTTGSVVGAGANVFGGAVMPKVIPPFAWGDSTPFATYDPAKFVAAAQRMMQRRGVELTEQHRAHIAAAHSARWTTD